MQFDVNDIIPHFTDRFSAGFASPNPHHNEDWDFKGAANQEENAQHPLQKLAFGAFDGPTDLGVYTIRVADSEE